MLGSQRLALPASVLAARPGLARYTDREVIVGIRPEHLSSEPGDGPGLEVMVDFVEMLGSEQLVHFTIDAPRVREESELREQAAAGTDQGEIVAASVAQSVARADPWAPIRPREKATFGVDVARLHFFDPETGGASPGRPRPPPHRYRRRPDPAARTGRGAQGRTGRWSVSAHPTRPGRPLVTVSRGNR